MKLKNPFKKKKRFSYKKFRLHHKVFFTMTGLIGVVLVWRGVWEFFDRAHILEHPIASAAVGLGLVAVSGAFFSML